MPTHPPIFSLEPVPGITPVPLEQPNGDLLVPAGVRERIADALVLIDAALDGASPGALKALRETQRLLAADPSTSSWHESSVASQRRNLLREYPLR